MFLIHFNIKGLKLNYLTLSGSNFKYLFYNYIKNNYYMKQIGTL